MRDVSGSDYAYVASSASNIFHRPNKACGQAIWPENLIGFKSTQEAIKKGYEPCFRCKPLETQASHEFARKKKYVCVKLANSMYFHKPTCELLKKIDETNLIGFYSIDKPRSLGFKRCNKCKPSQARVAPKARAKDDTTPKKEHVRVEPTATTPVPQPLAAQSRSSNPSSDGEQFIDFVAAELKRDMTYLSELGIKLDKGQLAAKTGGVAWAGYQAFTGNWLSALVIGGISLLVGSLTSSYKRIKVLEIQQKWKDRLSDLNRDQLEYLAEGLQRKHPVLMRRFQNLLQAG